MTCPWQAVFERSRGGVPQVDTLVCPIPNRFQPRTGQQGLNIAVSTAHTPSVSFGKTIECGLCPGVGLSPPGHRAPSPLGQEFVNLDVHLAHLKLHCQHHQQEEQRNDQRYRAHDSTSFEQVFCQVVVDTVQLSAERVPSMTPKAMSTSPICAHVMAPCR